MLGLPGDHTRFVIGLEPGVEPEQFHGVCEPTIVHRIVVGPRCVINIGMPAGPELYLRETFPDPFWWGKNGYFVSKHDWGVFIDLHTFMEV